MAPPPQISPEPAEYYIAPSLSRPWPPFSRLVETAAVWLSSAVFMTHYALSRGQDLNWDQLNYHVYSIYALLHDRYFIDIMPSQMQTWTNPLGNIIPYLIINNFSPRVATILLAVIASTSAPLIYLLTRDSLRDNLRPPFAVAVSALATIGAVSSPILLSEVGTTFNDYVSAIIILTAIYICFARKFDVRANMLAGGLLGLAVGIKLTNAPFVLGWGAALLAIGGLHSVRPLLMTGIPFAAVYALVGGLWNLFLYFLFRNPIFPLYNHIFRSDAYAYVPMLDERFKPKSFTAALEYFPKLALGQHPTTEVGFADIRFAVVALLAIFALPSVIELVVKPDRADAESAFDRKASLFVLTFAVVSCVFWLRTFGIERYALVLEQLAPLVMIILLSLLCGRGKVFLQAAFMGVGIIAALSKPADWGRGALSDSWYEVKAPAPLLSDNTLFVLLSSNPTSYIIPFLPKSDSFVRIEGNMPLDPDVGLGKLAKSHIEAHVGEIRTLAPADHPLDESRQRLERFGLALAGENCLVIETKAGPLKSCLLNRR